MTKSYGSSGKFVGNTLSTGVLAIIF